MPQQITLRLVKILVFVMGGLMILGFIAIIYGVMTKGSRFANTQNAPETNTFLPKPYIPSNSIPWQHFFALEKGDTLANSGRLQGNIWSITVKKANKDQIITYFYDVNTGNKFGEFIVTSSP